MKTVSVSDAKTHLSRLLEEALAGESIVIARAGRPVARLVPVDAPTPVRHFGSLAGQVQVDDAFFEPLPDDELEAWEG